MMLAFEVVDLIFLGMGAMVVLLIVPPSLYLYWVAHKADVQMMMREAEPESRPTVHVHYESGGPGIDSYDGSNPLKTHELQ